jgi:hypothetical protein
MPVKTGIQAFWIPAFAGMTEKKGQLARPSPKRSVFCHSVHLGHFATTINTYFAFSGQGVGEAFRRGSRYSVFSERLQTWLIFCILGTVPPMAGESVLLAFTFVSGPDFPQNDQAEDSEKRDD